MFTLARSDDMEGNVIMKITEIIVIITIIVSLIIGINYTIEVIKAVSNFNVNIIL
jgi:hypothetical protein